MTEDAKKKPKKIVILSIGYSVVALAILAVLMNAGRVYLFELNPTIAFLVGVVIFFSSCIPLHHIHSTIGDVNPKWIRWIAQIVVFVVMLPLMFFWSTIAAAWLSGDQSEAGRVARIIEREMPTLFKAQSATTVVSAQPEYQTFSAIQNEFIVRGELDTPNENGVPIRVSYSVYLVPNGAWDYRIAALDLDGYPVDSLSRRAFDLMELGAMSPPEMETTPSYQFTTEQSMESGPVDPELLDRLIIRPKELPQTPRARTLAIERDAEKVIVRFMRHVVGNITEGPVTLMPTAENTNLWLSYGTGRATKMPEISDDIDIHFMMLMEADPAVWSWRPVAIEFNGEPLINDRTIAAYLEDEHGITYDQLTAMLY